VYALPGGAREICLRSESRFDSLALTRIRGLLYIVIRGNNGRHSREGPPPVPSPPDRVRGRLSEGGGLGPPQAHGVFPRK
jgi:hypothetical protein